jgi:RNA polymerase sigma-70 factor (ECF subfamily)
MEALMSTMCLETRAGADAIGQASTSATPDERLMAQIAAGEQAALRALFTRHYSCVSRFVLRFVKDRDVVEEVVNDTFLIAWQQAPRFEGRSQVATWLLGIARHRALGAVRARQAHPESVDEQREATLVDPSERVDTRMQREDSSHYLKRCLAMLPRKQALLIELHYFRGKSLKEAAALTGAPLNTIKSRMFLARKKLATMLVNEDSDTAAAGSMSGERRSGPRLNVQAVC